MVGDNFCFEGSVPRWFMCWLILAPFFTAGDVG